MATRRTFLKASALAGGALGAAHSALARAAEAVQSKPKPLRILILGGTGFIGPHQVRYAVARGHQVTLFNRGRTNPGLFKGLSNIDERIGDRAPRPGNYDSLKSGEWDVVIDNPTTRPRWVREAAAALKGRVKHYVFISTISVYASHDTPGADETAAVATTTTPDVEEGPQFLPLYGPLKALAEQEAHKAFPDATTIIRPGLIVGVGDTTDRFTYWPVRIARGGEVLAPPAADPVQIIDARDLSEWVIRCCEARHLGVFNASGEGTRFTVGQMLEQTRAALGSSATFTHATTEFLLAQKVNPWSDLPVWLPAEGATAGAQLRSVAKARAAGLTYRPFADTVKETMAFYQQQSEERKAQLRAGLSAEREAAVLAAWKKRAG
ncbi:MAG: twin-arginine translocation signal domain-containing protein [Acidobacteria bacterium]|nr:twin-arginine translocation signal domain-containing protein [Acidobacteriota bacterium]